MFNLNEKQKSIFFYYIWSSSGSYTLKKNIKPITTLRRLVGNHDLSLKWTWSIMCQFQFKDFISIESCVWSWSLFHFHLLSGFWVKWHINNKHVPYLRNTRNIKTSKGDKNVIPLRKNINWDSIDSFLETEQNFVVVCSFEKFYPYLEIERNKKEFFIVK